MARRVSPWAALALAVLLLAWAPLHSAEEAAKDADDDDDAEPSKAFIVAHKYVAIEDDSLAYPLVVQGRNVTVNVILQNTGAATAEDVDFVDALPQNAKLVDGSLTYTVPKLASGSSARHSYVITFMFGGSMDVSFLPQGTVTYKSDDEGNEQIGKTSKSGIVVLTPVQQIQRYALMVGIYASLGICRTNVHWRNMAIFLGLIGGALGVNWGMKQATTSRTNVRRKKALEYLEKEE